MGAQQSAAVTGDDKGIRFEPLVVNALLTAIERCDPALAAHARRVAELALQIGRHLLYRDADLGRLRTAALLHDVGKIALSECIVRKAGPLNRREQTALRRHPELGYEIARRAPALGTPPKPFWPTTNTSMAPDIRAVCKEMTFRSMPAS